MNEPTAADHRSAAPYVFLDVDGVLNRFNRSTAGCEFHWVSAGDADQQNREFPIRIRTRVLEWVRAAAEVNDLRWATTWMDAANDHLAPAFDLPQLPVAARIEIAGPHQAASQGSWKLEGVLETVAANPKPFVWVDDEAIPDDVDEHLSFLGVPALYIRPNPYLGLSKNHLKEIDAFLALHAPA